MSNIEDLKKFKELLDAGVITEEDFEKKKAEVLSGNIQQETSAIESEGKKEKTPKKPLNKSLIKKIGIIMGIIAILALAFFAGQKIIEKNQHTKRAAALEAGIASIMDDYGLSTYTVKYTDPSYHVFADGFENLTNGEALSCLKELDSVLVDDPCGDGKIDFGTWTFVHPGLDIEYSYWRVSSASAAVSKIVGVGNKQAGIYCNRYGVECVFACDN